MAAALALTDAGSVWADGARALAGVTAEAAPFLFLGLFVAGLLHVLLPPGAVARRLGRPGLRSVLWGALGGAPLPLCSCSVLPVALGLRRSGASRGGTASFLVATPETGVDSIGVTWALMDPFLTLFRPLAAVFTAITAGLLVERGAREPAPDAPAVPGKACGSCPGDTPPAARRRGPVALLGEALRYALGPLSADLAGWLLFGLVASAALQVLLPEGFLSEHFPQGWSGRFLMLAVGVPFYICASASTPLAATLVAKGLEPGAAVVLLLAGPATNLASLGIVRREFGGTGLAAWLGAIAGGALLAGALADLWYSRTGAPTFRIAEAAVHEPGLLEQGAALALALLLLYHLGRRALRRRIGPRRSA